MSPPPPWGPITIPPTLDGAVLSRYLDFWTSINADWLRAQKRAGTPAPSIYQARVRYIPEPPGREVWLAAPHVMAMGGSVCHSLACWRAAELQVAGETDARAVWSVKRRKDGSNLYHVRVQRGANANPGGLEDPSALLGMGRPAAEVAMLGPVLRMPAVAGEVWY